jgi:hypothetical protein
MLHARRIDPPPRNRLTAGRHALACHLRARKVAGLGKCFGDTATTLFVSRETVQILSQQVPA